MNKKAKLLLLVSCLGLALFSVAAYFLIPRDPSDLGKYARSFQLVRKNARADGVPTSFSELYNLKLDDPTLGSYAFRNVIYSMNSGPMQYCLSPSQQGDFDSLWKYGKGDFQRLAQLGDCPAFGRPTAVEGTNASSVGLAGSAGRAMGMLGYERMKAGDADAALMLFEAGLKLGATLECVDANNDVATVGRDVRRYADFYLLMGAIKMFKDPAVLDRVLQIADAHHPIPDLQHKAEAIAVTAYQDWRDQFKEKLKKVTLLHRVDVDGVPYKYAKSPNILVACDAKFIEILHNCITAMKKAEPDAMKQARAGDAVILEAINDPSPVSRGVKAAFADLHLESTYKYFSFDRTAVLTAIAVARQYRKNKTVPKDLKAFGDMAVDRATGKRIYITKTTNGFVLSNSIADRDFLDDSISPYTVMSDQEYGGMGDIMFMRVSFEPPK